MDELDKIILQSANNITIQVQTHGFTVWFPVEPSEETMEIIKRLDNWIFTDERKNSRNCMIFYMLPKGFDVLGVAKWAAKQLIAHGKQVSLEVYNPEKGAFQKLQN